MDRLMKDIKNQSRQKQVRADYIIQDTSSIVSILELQLSAMNHSPRERFGMSDTETSSSNAIITR
jgi:hypothetical protein